MKSAPVSSPTKKAPSGDGRDEVHSRTCCASVIVCWLVASLPSGFNLGVVNTPVAAFKHFFNQSLSLDGQVPVPVENIEYQWSLAVALLLVGALVSSPFTGSLADHFGRKWLLFINGIIGIVGVSLCGVSHCLRSVPLFMAGRLVAGVHTGIGSSLVPMYLFELAAGHHYLANTLGTLFVVGVNAGQTLAQIVGLSAVLGTEHHWPWLFALNASLMVIGLPGVWLYCPESPIYELILEERRNELGWSALPMAGAVMPTIKKELKSKRQSRLGALCKHFHLDKAFGASLMIVCVLHACNQLVGINAVGYYSTSILKRVGLSESMAQYSSIALSAINVACPIAAVPLLRLFAPRHLLLLSGTVTAISLSVMTASMTALNLTTLDLSHQYWWLPHLTVVMMFTFVVGFALGQGFICYMISGELFEPEVFGLGVSVGVFVNWSWNFVIAITFPMMVLLIDQFVFAIFLAFNLFLLGFIYLKVPNTREPQPSNKTQQVELVNF